MVSPLCSARRPTIRSYCEILDAIKLLAPSQQSRGVSHVRLAEPGRTIGCVVASGQILLPRQESYPNITSATVHRT